MKKVIFVFLALISIVIISGCTDTLTDLSANACDALASDEQAHCYKGVAVSTSNADLCGKISSADTNPKAQCYNDVAVAKGDVSLCDKIPFGFTAVAKIECIEAVAIKNNDPSLCNLITTSVSRGGGFSVTSKETCLKRAGTTETQNTDECRFDSDCGYTCTGNTLWKRGCDAQTNKCKNTFDTVCDEKYTQAGNYKFSYICKVTGDKQASCVKDSASIDAEILKVETQLKDVNSRSQQGTALYSKTAKNCISALSDVTNNLIVSSAKDIGFPITSLADAVTNYVEEGLKFALSGSFSAYTPTMSVEDFIKINCGAERALKDVLTSLGKKQDELIQKLKYLEQAKNA